MADKKTYECTADHCTLGTLGAPGYFTGGMMKEQKHMLTGRPLEQIEDGEYGEGVCPNCGTPGKEVS